MVFTNRQQAGKLLADRLKNQNLKNPVLIALPRGGVPVAIPLANMFKKPIYILPVRKIGHPTNPEFAIGAISRDSQIISETTPQILKVIEKEERKIRNYEKKFNRKPPNNLKNKDVVIIDDGIATGTTVMVAINSLRKKNPRSVTIATPICTNTAATSLKTEVDKWVCLDQSDITAIGNAYLEFEQLTDNEVANLLEQTENTQKKAF